MTDANPRAVIGANNPPDPIDEITSAYEDDRLESENWLDGTVIETEGQMLAVDKLRKAMRDCRLALENGQKSATAPLYDAYKAEMGRWKPAIDDHKRIEAGLVAIGDGFKRKLAAEKEAARKKAEAEAWEATRRAQEAARAADATNIEAQRAAAEADAAAKEAQRRASAAAKDTVKGLRTVTRYDVLDEVLLARWLWTNDRAALVEFNADRARKLELDLPGIVARVTTKEAY